MNSNLINPKVLNNINFAKSKTYVIFLDFEAINNWKVKNRKKPKDWLDKDMPICVTIGWFNLEHNFKTQTIFFNLQNIKRKSFWSESRAIFKNALVRLTGFKGKITSNNFIFCGWGASLENKFTNKLVNLPSYSLTDFSINLDNVSKSFTNVKNYFDKFIKANKQNQTIQKNQHKTGFIASYIGSLMYAYVNGYDWVSRNDYIKYSNYLGQYNSSDVIKMGLMMKDPEKLNIVLNYFAKKNSQINSVLSSINKYKSQVLLFDKFALFKNLTTEQFLNISHWTIVLNIIFPCEKNKKITQKDLIKLNNNKFLINWSKIKPKNTKCQICSDYCYHELIQLQDKEELNNKIEIELNAYKRVCKLINKYAKNESNLIINDIKKIIQQKIIQKNNQYQELVNEKNAYTYNQ
ncbi:hypothetical protein GE118_01665 [Mycoplasma sp. NEAQ87857]|uniref:hypothetical protein n=1 Tax=Mycoplasma sp. NEAQ87857 TaxID=2683967 RepID=UPI001318E55B|nr:hypothetical protein [Mycoplasma sp. NEAQ87857]QGZ97503.1 hypothetical protein GE118_01665 [Mycoplasma sp. NEAQ87857]